MPPPDGGVGRGEIDGVAEGGADAIASGFGDVGNGPWSWGPGRAVVRVTATGETPNSPAADGVPSEAFGAERAVGSGEEAGARSGATDIGDDVPVGPARPAGTARAIARATDVTCIVVSSHPVSPFSTTRPTKPERMDDDDVPQDEIDTTFRFIRSVNRWLGGTSACLTAMIRDRARWPKDRPLRWLDVGTGAADIPLAVDRWATRHGVAVECVALDRHPACLRVARAAVEGHPRITVVEGDALALTEAFPVVQGVEPFDYVHAGMFLHHLPDQQVITVLRSMGRLARRQVIWNDLLRSRWSAAAIRVATVGQPPIIRDDASLSVAKGFTPNDAREAARWAGLERVEVRCRRLVGRFVLTAERA